ncbi:class I SAM-dependent methyltransferase [Rubellicoccus peritrichatus]|uniref:Class I SAM-dependent methyltransferase n=1 Tax=Rubellicoccus peritrichatus TaxID=3080537 RepID=A0AAQ3LES8_9BACT|nr:class I SAM-dependent methyltransferase [Puniceicoccus sp. CR14]WOO42313.1 class I SAM-dependent methyltransferase [Puniceicoccus sp. CR14]
MKSQRPHLPLSDYYATNEDKQTFLRKLFDRAAPHYEGIAKWGWFGSGQFYRKWALERVGLRPGMAVLDVASGTGPTARAIRDVQGSEEMITCLEPSAGMIAESKKQLSCEHIQAGADKMPLPDESFDFLTMGFALRHVDDLASAFSEFYRVIKPGAKIMIMDETLPKKGFRRSLMKLYFKHMLPWLTKIFTRSQPAHEMMAYYWQTLEEMVPPEEVVAGLEAVGFQQVKHNLLLGMFSEYTAIRPQ